MSTTVHLKQHPALQSSLADSPVNAHHCQLDQIGSRSLERRILGVALAVCALIEIPLLHLRDVPAPLEQSLYVPLPASQIHLPVEEGANP
jgi:hypothetical protein